MKMWIFNCREVSHLVSEAMDRRLNFSKKLGVRFHLLMCRHCARFANQLATLRQLLKSKTDDTPPLTMDKNAKQKLRHILEEHLNQKP